MLGYLFLALTTVFTVISQVLQKQVADTPIAGNHPGWLQRLKFYLFLPRLWFSFAALFIAMLSWLVVIDVMDISKAYPLLSLNYVLMLIVSRWLFSETIPLSRWFGVALIFVGIAFIGSG